MASITATIQLRRDTAADWTTNDPTLLAGEVGLETDTNRLKIGDGATAWSSLDYFGRTVPTVHIRFSDITTSDPDNPTLSEVETWATAQSVTASFAYYTGADDPASAYIAFFWISAAGRAFECDDPNELFTDLNAVHVNGAAEFFGIAESESITGSETFIVENAALEKEKFTVTKLLQEGILDSGAGDASIVDTSDTTLRTIKRANAGAGMEVTASTSRVDFARKFTAAGKMAYGGASGVYTEIDSTPFGRGLLSAADAAALRVTTFDSVGDIGTPVAGDRIIIQDASDSNIVKYATFDEFGGTGYAQMIEQLGPAQGITNYTPSSSTAFWGATAVYAIYKMDLANFTRARIWTNIGGAANQAGSKVEIYYKTGAYSETVGDYATIASTGVCGAATDTTSTITDSGWVDMAGAAQADNIYIAIVTTGMNGSSNVNFRKLVMMFDNG